MIHAAFYDEETRKVSGTISVRHKDFIGKEEKWAEIPPEHVDSFNPFDWEADEAGNLVQVSVVAEGLEAIAQVNAAVDEARRAHVTPITGQEAVYAAKEREGVAYLAEDGTPPFEGYPLIATEVIATGRDAYEVAQLFVNLAEQSRRRTVFLEQIRRTAIDEIENATTSDAIDDAMEHFHGSFRSLP